MSRYGRDGDCRVHLKRNNYNVAWGFRLQGGRDAGTPLTVQRVFSGSPSDGQLQRGDVVLTVDDRDVTNFNLNQVQDLLKSTGDALSVVVRRTRDLVNDTSSVKQPISLQQQPSFASSNKNTLGLQDYTAKIQTGVSQQYHDYDNDGTRSNYNQPPKRFESHQTANLVSSSSYFPEPTHQTPVQPHNQASNRQATVRQSNVQQVQYQTPARQAQATTNQSFQKQETYRTQDFNQNTQPVSEQYDDRRSFNTQQQMTRPNAAQSANQQFDSQRTSQQYSTQERQWHSPDRTKHGFSDEQSQFSSNEYQPVYQAMNQDEEEEEQPKSIQEIKEMFNKPTLPTPRVKPRTPPPSKLMSARNTLPSQPMPARNTPPMKPTPARNTPPYQQKSSYNPLEFVGVTGKPKSPSSKQTGNPPGAIQRGPPVAPIPTAPSSQSMQSTSASDPLMDFYLHGFDAKHGVPPTEIKFNGISSSQSAPKPRGNLLPPRTIPAVKPAPAKKQDFNPAQSAVYRMLLEEEERGKGGDTERADPVIQRAPKQAQNQPRKVIKVESGSSHHSSLQQLLEKDQAQLAPYQEEEPNPYQVTHQTYTTHQQLQTTSNRGSSMPSRNPETSNQGAYESSTSPYATHNRPYDSYQAQYPTQNNYSNAPNYYVEPDRYGANDDYPVTDF